MAQASTNALDSAGVSKVATDGTAFQWDNPNQRPFGRETQTLWNYKAITVPGAGRLVGMIDVFNVTNSDVVTNFNHSTGTSFLRVISLLDLRIVRLGIRWEF